MSDERPTRGKPARPVRWGGQDYPSQSAAVRGRYGTRYTPNGQQWRKLQEALARGEAELLPRPYPTDAPGATGTARRVMRAAREIAHIAREGADAGGTKVEIAGRRRGLVKALWLYRQRFGVGVSDVLEGEL